MRRPRRRTVGLVLLAVVALLLAGGAWYVEPQPLLPEAAASLASTAEVAFTDRDGRLEWSPTAATPDTGLVVYPGGKVPAAAYGPLAQRIARAGFLVVIEPMPLNLAVLGIGAADEAIAAHPEIAHWAVGGHSLGGAMAAQYLAGAGAGLEGLALWAAYSPTDLSARDLAVVSVYGSRDAGRGRMASGANLPPGTVFVEIEGGNHEQMGWYTGQPDDPPATIPRAEQQDRAAAATVELLRRLPVRAP